MSFSSTSLLQFDELLTLLARYSGSEAGRELITTLEPHSDRAALESDLAEAEEAIQWLEAASRGELVRLRFDQIPSVETPIRLLKVEGVSLEGRDFLDLFAALAVAGEYRSLVQAAAGRFPKLAYRSSKLADLRHLVKRYERVFLPDGSLSDDASPVLKQIRRDMARQQRQIEESLERFMRAHRNDGALQEDFITLREDRFVVPIVSGQKGRVDGVIHGSSGTGRTLFLEPLETVGLNNQLVRLREDELREIERILAEITDQLREHRDEIATTAQGLAELDLIFAKGGFARDFDAVVPKFSADAQRRLILRDARHPLLESVLRKQRKPIVPISFDLDEERRCLLISGPNTGGKTVTMKTTGLLALMAHAGIPVPCAEAEFPLLDDVLADIGDTQSIEESLSSFSGHLLHVKQMLERVTADSLVLLDELGRATDPDEGGALGVGILDEFRKSGAFCLASTHLLPLKLYGTHTSGVLNASMGFNGETLQPTYKLKLGIPGKSAGLDIATRLEMPRPVMEHARAVLPKLQASFESLLSELHQQIDSNAQRARELESAAEQFRSKQAAVESDAVKREQKRQREWNTKVENLIADFEARAQMIVKQLREGGEQRKAVAESQRLVAKTRREFREEAAQTMAPPPEMARQTAAQTLLLEEGARVRLKDVREIATVRRLLKNGVVEVEAGFLKMQVPREEIVEVVSKTEERKRLPKNVSLETGPSWNENYRELNLIGERAEEAIARVDKFLDSAALASVDRVRIVHGHGMGILKRAVNEYLGTSPHVSRFYPATPSEGGSGATVVELRD